MTDITPEAIEAGLRLHIQRLEAKQAAAGSPLASSLAEAIAGPTAKAVEAARAIGEDQLALDALLPEVRACAEGGFVSAGLLAAAARIVNKRPRGAAAAQEGPGEAQAPAGAQPPASVAESDPAVDSAGTRPSEAAMAESDEEFAYAAPEGMRVPDLGEDEAEDNES